MSSDVVITVGWHAMRIGEDGMLYTPARGILWDARFVRVSCPLDPSHEPPIINCSCGIYLWYTEKEAMEHGLKYGAEPEELALVRMRALEGSTVIIHENGLRTGAVETVLITTSYRSGLNLAFYWNTTLVRLGKFNEASYAFI